MQASLEVDIVGYGGMLFSMPYNINRKTYDTHTSETILIMIYNYIRLVHCFRDYQRWTNYADLYVNWTGSEPYSAILEHHSINIYKMVLYIDFTSGLRIF